MGKLLRTLQKAEVTGEKVKTLVQYPSQALQVSLLWSSKQRETQVLLPRNEKYRIPWEAHCGESRFVKRKGEEAAFFSTLPWKGSGIRQRSRGLQTVHIIHRGTRAGLRQHHRRGNWLLPGEQNKHQEGVTTSLTQQEQKCEPHMFFYLFSYTSCVYFSLVTSNVFLS